MWFVAIGICNRPSNTRSYVYYIPTSIAANHITMLLQDIIHNWSNKKRALWTIVSAVGRHKSIRIPDILSSLWKPNSLYVYVY